MSSGLVETCVSYQLNKCKNPYFKEELIQETYLWLMTYDIEKLQDAYVHRHLNALITRYLINQWFSNTSPFYKNFKRFDMQADEITQKELDIPDTVSLDNLPDRF